MLLPMLPCLLSKSDLEGTNYPLLLFLNIRHLDGILDIQMVYQIFRWCTRHSDGVLDIQMVYQTFRWCTRQLDGVLDIQMVYQTFRWYTRHLDGVLDIQMVYQTFRWCNIIPHGIDIKTNLILFSNLAINTSESSVIKKNVFVINIT